LKSNQVKKLFLQITICLKKNKNQLPQIKKSKGLLVTAALQKWRIGFPKETFLYI
jgi:hypothetical protein